MGLSKFENVKMRVTPEQSERVQKAVFAAGGKWGAQDAVVRLVNEALLFVGQNMVLISNGEDIGLKSFLGSEREEVDPDAYAAELEAYVEQLEETKRKQEASEQQPVTPISEQEPIESDFDAEKVGADTGERRQGVTINNETDSEVITEHDVGGEVVITIKNKKPDIKYNFVCSRCRKSFVSKHFIHPSFNNQVWCEECRQSKWDGVVHECENVRGGWEGSLFAFVDQHMQNSLRGGWVGARNAGFKVGDKIKPKEGDGEVLTVVKLPSYNLEDGALGLGQVEQPNGLVFWVDWESLNKCYELAGEAETETSPRTGEIYTLDRLNGFLGRKDDKLKRHYSLVPSVALDEVVDVMTFGAQKYAPNNWQHVGNARERYYNAAMRHIQAWWQGELRDGETGLHHLAHAVCCLMFLIWFDKND